MKFQAYVSVDNGEFVPSMATDAYRLEREENGERYLVRVMAKRALKSIKFRLECDFDYDGKVAFVNGYQSWTPSKEYCKTDKMLPLSKWCKALEPFVHSSAYGDYKFARYSKKAGYFHSFSYGYVSKGGDSDVFLIGSLNERTGYTIIYYDMNKSKLIIEKDLEGLSLEENQRYEVMDICLIEGAYDDAFDKYFELLNVAKPKIGHQNGYTSWYNYYQNISENIIARDLDNLSKLVENVDIFQIDDGFQTAVGDWLSIDSKKFPNGMKAVVDNIHSKNMKAGLWLAPF
ncbi:MAG: alpha-galactosidase, partial [Clostridia bacterium]